MRGPRTAMKSGPRLPQLEKALAQKRRPNTAINKINKFKKMPLWRKDYVELNAFEKTKDTGRARFTPPFCLKSRHKFPLVKVT